MQSDPSIPEPLRAALVRRGFSELTAVQRAVLEPEASGRNLRISSKTGSGKTVALGLVLARDLDGTVPSGTAALVVTPTRELATQVRDELQWLFADVPAVRVEAVTGGTDMMRERTMLRRAPTILVATPGRLLDHIRRGTCNCKAVRQLVLDEADRMLDMGFREDLEAIVEALPIGRRSHLVSATFPPQVRKLADRVQTDALHLQGSVLGTANADIEHVATVVERSDTYAAIVNALLLAHGERVLVFVERRTEAAELADRLGADGFAVQPFSGELSQPQRVRTLDAFRKGTIDILISTDVAARGIDIPEISMVIHADLPNDADCYTHRSGRTGRAGRKGKSLLLIPPRARRQAVAVLQSAKVHASWRPLPTTEAIREALAQRTHTLVQAQLERSPEPSDRERAAQLLAGRDAEDVVATLLAMAAPKLPCAPKSIRAMPFDEPARPARIHEAPHQGAFVRFSINWGRRKGATPSRVLSHVCRRGEIASAHIGAIEIRDAFATFEVAEPASGDFEQRVRVPDQQEPHLEIERAPHGNERAQRPRRPRR